MSDEAAVRAAVELAHRREWALVVAATTRTVRDLDLAEECVQEAYAAALRSWVRDGIPANPAAWLTTAARRRGVDALRRRATLRAKLPLLVEPGVDDGADGGDASGDASRGGDWGEDVVADERLRLVFLCCHPALAEEAQVALTLRLVCGLATADIARAFLVPETTMAARLTRAKRKIAGSRIPFRLPGPAELPGRLRGVLGVVHLLFTTGCTAPSGQELVRADLVDAALGLARVLHQLLPDEPEVSGLLALLLATDARRATRTSADGRLVRLADQDRSRWDRAAVAEAHGLVMGALPHPAAGRYVLQAAIACQHAEAPTAETTDWVQILGLYDALLAVWPSPVVALNRAIACAEVAGPAAALAAVEALEHGGQLDGYPYLHATRAELLGRLGRTAEAQQAWQEAYRHTGNATEREFLREQLLGP